MPPDWGQSSTQNLNLSWIHNICILTASEGKWKGKYETASIIFPLYFQCYFINFKDKDEYTKQRTNKPLVKLTVIINWLEILCASCAFLTFSYSRNLTALLISYNNAVQLINNSTKKVVKTTDRRIELEDSTACQRGKLT